jgi:hypothetical protein
MASLRCRRSDSRPNDHAGHARAAFKHRRLAAAQRAVAGGRGAIDFVVHVAAVVGGEDDDRVVRELEPVEPSSSVPMASSMLWIIAA